MQEKDEKFNLDHYINLIFRHRWLIIIPSFISLVIGIILVFVLPKIYESSTLILVESQRVPTDYVKSVVSSDIEERVSTIKQQVLSRTNLEKIIMQFGLFSEPKHEKMFMEDKIEGLRDSITVRVVNAWKGSDAFFISTKAKEPEIAMNITNTLASFFIEENLKIRETQASGTKIFLDEELNEMRGKLEEVETKLGDYRKRFMGELPEQLNSNLRLLSTLQIQLEERKERLRSERNKLMILKSDIEESKKLFASVDSEIQTEPDDISTLAQLKNQLAKLKTSYTDQHPDVIKLKNRIADLEKNYKNDSLGSSDILSTELPENKSKKFLPKSLRDKNMRLAEITAAIENLEEDVIKINQEIKEYQKRVERTPKREEELMSLKRDYENINQSYSSLLNRKLEAEIAVNMEKKKKGERFRILDLARLPEKPTSPNLKLLFLLASFAGLGIGGGLVYVLDYFDTSVKDIEEFQSNIGVAVMATIPKVYHPRDIRLKRLNQMLTGLSIFIALCLLAGFALLTFKGVGPTMEIVRPYLAFLKI